MPFPLAHPAAVLPLLRKPFVASALVAGSVAPSSAIWLGPLVALVILLVFHLVVKEPLLALAPGGLRSRLPGVGLPRIPAPAQLFWIVVSTIIGTITHVLWDLLEVNRVLRYVSSIGGLVIIAIWLVFWWRRTTPGPTDTVPTRARYVVLIAAAVLGAVGAVIQLVGAEGGETLLRLGLTGFANGALVALGWYVVIWQVLRLRKGPVSTL